MRNIFLLSPCGTCRAACVGVMPGIGRPVAPDLRPGKRPCGQGRKNWKQRVPEPVKSKIHHRSGFAALDRISVVGFKGAIHDRIPVAGEGFSGKIPFSWMLRHAIRTKFSLSSCAGRQWPFSGPWDFPVKQPPSGKRKGRGWENCYSFHESSGTAPRA